MAETEQIITRTTQERKAFVWGLAEETQRNGNVSACVEALITEKMATFTTEEQARIVGAGLARMAKKK